VVENVRGVVEATYDGYRQLAEGAEFGLSV